MQKFMFRQTARFVFAALLTTASVGAMAALPEQGGKSPALIISNDPLPPELQSRIYSEPARAPDTSAAQLLGSDESSGETVVGRKVDELRSELFSLQGKVAQMSVRLSDQESTTRRQAADYYANVATINTQLQAGTTAGNPRLVRKLDAARNDLEILSGSVSSLNGMAMDISSEESMANFLLQSAQAAYSLTGAVEEDHVRLAKLEDAVNATVVVINRMLNNVNDDITHMAAYVGTERGNLRTLGLAVQTGDLLGKNLSNRPFASASLANFSGNEAADNTGADNGDMTPAALTPVTKSSMSGSGVPNGARPLAKIRFDRPDVAYEQPVYMAVKDALNRYPNARFELVAVHPNSGNAAEVAIESTRARRDAEKVLRSLTQMGLPLNRIDLSYMPSAEATSDEVHLYVR